MRPCGVKAQQEELQRGHGGQAVINIVEGALIDVELTLPAGTAAIEGQVVEIDPGAVLVLQFQPDGVALVRGEVGVLVHPVLELVHDAAIGQEEEAVLGVEQGVFSQCPCQRAGGAREPSGTPWP